MREEDYCRVLQNASHYRALGISEVYLDSSSSAFPWQYVTSVEEGGSHRLDINTSVWFRAKEPTSGITFRWTFDIEPYSANGSGSYHIDVGSCKRVLALLPPEGRVLFREYLAKCAAAVKSKGDEWMECAMRQQRDARILQDLATAEVCAEQPTTSPAVKHGSSKRK